MQSNKRQENQLGMIVSVKYSDINNVVNYINSLFYKYYNISAKQTTTQRIKSL